MADPSASSVPPVVTTGSVVTPSLWPRRPPGGGSTVSADKFAHAHRVFGTSNVIKILNDLQPYYQREDAVNSLIYEADMRVRNPVYGCIGVVSILQHCLLRLKKALERASLELSKYQAAAAASASVAVGSHGVAAAGMADFVGNAVPNNCTQNIVNVGHSTIASINGAGPFMQQDNFASVQMLARSFEGENGAAARVGMNGGGGYGFAYSPAMGVGHGVVSGHVQQINGG
uniref:LOB domain-containing protein n=1 Tax=Zea mays TaxID=4577 RepID=A0A804R7C6_MAIZE